MSKLTAPQLERARSRAAHAALLAYANRQAVHYTQGAARWSGIAGRRVAIQGEYPFNADCSAFTTWCLWNGLYVAYGKPDVVNGAHWDYGFTGTQIQHGRQIAKGLKKADLVFYAYSGSTPTHVAIVVGRRNNKPYVVSHGNEAGPLFLPFDYRRRLQIRRYIRDGV